VAVTYRGWRVFAVLATVAILVAGLISLGRGLVKHPRDALVDGQSGSWWFPRGGPYILGFWSPTPASLEIDGETVASGSGVVQKRVLYDEGVHSVTFRAPPVARLLWHPPGRRGAPEYVSASSLSREPAEFAYFTAPGTDHELAAVAFLILLVVVLGCLKLVAPFEDGRISGPGVLIFVVAVGIRLWGLGGTGQTWDEDEYWSAGRNDVQNLFEGDFSNLAWSWNQQHPPVTKYLAGVGALAEDGYTAARLLFIACSAGACVLTFAVGRRLFGGRAGFLAGMTAALLPHLVAHGRIVGHETPSVFLWALAVWLALAAADDQDRPLWQALRFVCVGVALGLAVATRFTNLLAAPVVGLSAILLCRRQTLLRTAAAGLFIIPTVGVATVVAVWPRLWHDAEAHLHAAWDVLKVQHLPEMYLGREVQLPPWHYFPMYLLATTPLLVLVAAFVIGGARGVWRRERAYLLLLAWLIFPFGVAYSPVRQDGMRYVLPVLLPVALLAGAGLDWLMANARRVQFLLGVVVVAYLARATLIVSPYELDYFGEQVGGVSNVAQKHWFEVGWWGEGIGEAVEWLNDHVPSGAKVARLVVPAHVTWLRSDLWPGLRDLPGGDAEWLFVNDLWIDTYGRGFTPPPDASLVHEVSVDGASLVKIYMRRAKP
jgi:4-amino-4-deoxy-L-arabinose transferase-like glycosyltransferase